MSWCMFGVGLGAYRVLTLSNFWWPVLAKERQTYLLQWRFQFPIVYYSNSKYSSLYANRC